MKTTVTLNSQEQQRIKRLNEHMAGLLSVEQVAELMHVSKRQVYRWKASYREKGVEAMAHGNRGKTSPHRIAEPIRAQIVHQACEVYAGCNQHHVRDLLEEREGIVISRSSLRRLLQEAGKASVKPVSKPKHRLRRPRYRQEGQLVQIDASPHAWLQDRGPRLSLVGGIDDATGKVVGAIFREQEDQQGYFEMIEQMVERYGAPLALYHDRHTMFPSRRYDVREDHSLPEQLQGTQTQTQLGRLFTQIRSTSIAARSPQAKGRIERLWGTFQDRLVSELRLAHAQTMEEANVVLQDYLPRFNARFAVPAAEMTLAWQALPESVCARDIFCWHEERTVSNDNTISYHGRSVQLLPSKERRSWVRCKVMVHEQFDGTLSIVFQDRGVPAREAPKDPVQQRRQATTSPTLLTQASTKDDAVEPGRQATTTPTPSTQASTKDTHVKAHPPKANHPWRKQRAVSSS